VNNNSFDTIDINTAKTPARVITVLHAIIRAAFYFVSAREFFYQRVFSGAAMIAAVFLVTGSKSLTKRQISVLAPVFLAIIELTTVTVVEGDRLVYVFLIGCSLFCLLYADITGLFISSFLISVITAFFIFVLDVRLLGFQFRLADDIFNFAGVVLMYLLIFLLGKYSVSTLSRFRSTGQTFDTILATSPNLIVIVNDMARVDYISKSLAELLGLEKQEYAIKLPFTDLFSTPKLKLFFGELLRRKGQIDETFSIDFGGRQRWFMLHSVPIGESKVARLFDSVEITPIVEARQAAEEASRSKSNFLATMSHEIRTPMNAIIGITQIQLQKENLNGEYAPAFEMIYRSGNNLLGIINDILDMSKIETGRLELNPTEYYTANLINDAVQLNILRIGSKQIVLTVDVDKNLPSLLYGDELRLKQILNNLLSNAIKYTEKGHVKLSVRHETEGGIVTLRFVIEDTGQGIKGEDQKRLFSEYLRFNAGANRSTEGTGLGLSITKKLAEMMDGAIAVESEYGKGSIFTVTVKQKAVECEALGEELARKLCNFTFTEDARDSKPRILGTPMPGGSVLVVDDVETNLFVAEGLLAPYQLKVETALSGFEAMEKAEKGGVYDIIFMDHMMPQMDGMETTQKLRAMGYSGVIVALTANALAGNDEMFTKNGFDDFLSKPIDTARLDSILRKWIPEEKRKQGSGNGEQLTGDKSLLPDTFSLLPVIPGVDVEHGIAMTGGTAARYRQVLALFRKDAEKRLGLLREAPDEAGLPLFTTQVHALKSASASLGALPLSREAEKLEAAGKAGDLAFIRRELPGFAARLEELAAAIGAALKATEEKANATAPQATAPQDATASVSLLLDLQKALTAQKTDLMDKTLEELDRQTTDPAIRESLETISDHVLMAEFEEALALLQTLICR
jgi:signal transduction histidine kinase/CheY-like chemotaxis protein